MTDQSPAIVDNTYVSPRACGPCTFCCEVLHGAPPPKPADFQCIWTFAAPLDESWRPDRCRFVLRSGPAEELVIDVDPAAPGAWKREPFYGQIKAWSTRVALPIRPVLVRSAGHVYVVFPEGEVDLGPEQGRTPIQSGYVFRDGRNQPYAHYGTNPDPPPAPARAR